MSEGTNVRITHVDVYPVPIAAPSPPYRWRDGLPVSRGEFTGCVLRIRTDEGVDGVALAPRPGAYPLLQSFVDRLLREELVGGDPLAREWWWHRIWELDRLEELPLYLFGVLDVALWDLAGRASGLPSWKVMGYSRTSLPAYASTVTYESIEEFLDVADQCLELGFRAIKLHAWGDVSRDIALIHALREHVGDDLPLMYDGSAGFDLPDAIRVGRALTDAGYLWYEEPMREFSVSAYRSLGDAVGVPLLVAETSDGVHMNAADFIASGCATFGVRASSRLRGGVTGSLRIAHLADAFRLRAEVHGDDIANQHLCMAISNTTYYESLVRTTTVRRAPEIDASGHLRAPEGPGIGLPATLALPPELEEYVASGSVQV